MDKINIFLENNIYNIIIAGIFGLILTEIWNFIKIRILNKETAEKISNLKFLNSINYIFKYFFPLLILLYVVIWNNLVMTPRNVISLVVIFNGFIYQILISHILNLYDLQRKKIEKDTDLIKQIDETFNKVYQHVEDLK